MYASRSYDAFWASLRVQENVLFRMLDRQDSHSAMQTKYIAGVVQAPADVAEWGTQKGILRVVAGWGQQGGLMLAIRARRVQLTCCFVGVWGPLKKKHIHTNTHVPESN